MVTLVTTTALVQMVGNHVIVLIHVVHLTIAQMTNLVRIIMVENSLLLFLASPLVIL